MAKAKKKVVKAISKKGLRKVKGGLGLDGSIISDKQRGGESSLISYYSQPLADSVEVMSSLTKSTSNIEKNTMQSMGRDLAQS